MNKKLVDCLSDSITLEEFAASESFYRLHRFKDCPLTFIYNTVTCNVSIYDGKDTDSLILEVHNKNTRFLQRDIQRLINIVFEKNLPQSTKQTKVL